MKALQQAEGLFCTYSESKVLCCFFLKALIVHLHFCYAFTLTFQPLLSTIIKIPFLSFHFIIFTQYVKHLADISTCSNDKSNFTHTSNGRNTHNSYGSSTTSETFNMTIALDQKQTRTVHGLHLLKCSYTCNFYTKTLTSGATLGRHYGIQVF